MHSAAVGSSSRAFNGSFRPQAADAQSALRAVTECSGSSVVIHVGGDIDASNESAWRHLLSQGAAQAVAPGSFVIDLRELDFMGSRGYAVLAHEAVQCRGRGISLRLVTSQPIVAHTLTACGLRPLVPTYATVETALAVG
ncbi:anti-sigma factor antagonist [Mycobacterium shigaense]|nr:anti-sigma factor antagonist [Mycobacterium shigaense]MEA1123579.1 anti-sigma factor antagonist [Mycobacterium shigaense]PRI13911.1 anti-anti-sigma factor [Mycobacterium shigaense]